MQIYKADCQTRYHTLVNAHGKRPVKIVERGCRVAIHTPGAKHSFPNHFFNVNPNFSGSTRFSKPCLKASIWNSMHNELGHLRYCHTEKSIVCGLSRLKSFYEYVPMECRKASIFIRLDFQDFQQHTPSVDQLPCRLNPLSQINIARRLLCISCPFYYSSSEVDSAPLLCP